MTAIVKKLKLSKQLLINLGLTALLIILAVWPLLTLSEAGFEGADGEAEEVILEISDSYEPWFAPLLEPKSGEIESLLFALQAAVGSGVVFYGLGYMVGKSKKEMFNINDQN